MARLVGRAVSGDVVVVTCESESFRVTADEGCHGKVLVRARGRTVNDNQINVAHDCTKNELIIAVSTVMMNWMIVFHVLRSFKYFIIVNSKLYLLLKLEGGRNYQELVKFSFHFW